MHPAPGLVCSDRPEGCLLSCFDPSATQTVPTVCVRRSGMAVQGPPLRALPVSPCVHKGRRRRPYPVTGGGCQDPQLPRRLAYPSPIQRAVGQSQGLGAPAPQPVGASGQLGKEQALPCAENLFSRCGVRLGEYDATPHGGTCPSSAELPEFLQRQECGTTETVSEAPGAYDIRSCSQAARIASYETTSALATLPGPEVGMAHLGSSWSRGGYTASGYHPAVSLLPQPLDGPCLSTGRGAPRSQFLPVCWVSNGREELAGVTLAAPFPLTRGYERLFFPQFSSPDGEPWWNPPSTPGSQTGRSSLTPGPVLVLARPGLRSAPVLG